MLIFYDYTRLTSIFFLKEKSEAFEKFKIYKSIVENETDLKIKCLRLDNGGQFTSKEFIQFFGNHGMKRQFLAPVTSQQNGLVERKNITVKEVARTMLNESNLLYKL
jgi:transposase InsO family protein